MRLAVDIISSPVGDIILIASDVAVYSLDFAEYEPRMMQLLERYHGSVTLEKKDNPGGISTLIREYFAGKLNAFDTIETVMGGTVFQQRVWKKLRDIPPAMTWSYGQLAAAIDSPKAVRAVGMGNAKNPVALIVPCHRIIGSNGTLTGYAGGIERKQWLLSHEKRYAA